MINPLVRYKTYHKNNVNVYIHQGCVPLLLLSIYSIPPIYVSFAANAFYSISYLMFDVFSKKSIQSVYYMQSIFLLHFLFRYLLSIRTNVFIHVLSWTLQIASHKIFEKNTPALLDNLFDSFLFAPYFTFLETFYPETFNNTTLLRNERSINHSKEKYTIVKSGVDSSKRSIVYFAGLFQKSNVEYDAVSKDLSKFNHVYINVNFTNDDVYKETLVKIAEELEGVDIECVVGFSFGGSLSLQFKQCYFEKYQKDVKTVLISPGGFESNSILEKVIRPVGSYLYSIYCNDKWYMIKNYPTYQNARKLTSTDYLIVSTGDSIHYPTQELKTHENVICLKNAQHLSMVSVVKKQHILSQLVENEYQVQNVKTKPLSSTMNKLLFGGHFYYNVALWTGVSFYNFYVFVKNQYTYANFIYGFLFASSLWSFTEYVFHRVLLHNILYTHHKKHHTYPNKLSIINTPMSMVILNWCLYYFVFNRFINHQVMFCYYIFFPLNYLSFEFTHLLSHSYKGSNKIVLNAKYYHKLHHVDENVNYSFVTPFWDYLFGTLSPKYEMNSVEMLVGILPFWSFYIHDDKER